MLTSVFISACISLAYICGVFNMHIQTSIIALLHLVKTLHIFLCVANIVMHTKGVGMCVDRYLAGFNERKQKGWQLLGVEPHDSWFALPVLQCLSITSAVHIEDCEGWWLSSCNEVSQNI